MSDRAVIADIFLELTGAQFKRAKGFLKDHGVPGGTVEQVKDADDMADLIRRHFESSKRKTIILDILKKTKCEDVIEMFNEYLSKSTQRIADGDEASVTAQNVTSSDAKASTLSRRKRLYDDLNNKLGVDEEDKLRHLLEGNQLEKRELQELKNVTGILNRLDDKGEFDHGFELLKDLLKQIQRKPLIKLVEQCERDMARETSS
ncbi:uncharacterized protein [Ptychodera flava]|uniref:uncharacterized protein n=1 Tax=Ptychodera flava TaxID=63121 RepID=UPI00396A9D9C